MARNKPEEPAVEPVVEEAVEATPEVAEEAAPDAPQTAEEALYAWADDNGHERDVGILRNYAPHEMLEAYDEEVAAADPDPVEEAPAEDTPAEDAPADAPVEDAPAEEPSEG